MSAQTDTNVEQLARLHARQRSILDRIWFFLTVICLLGGGIAWLTTRDFEHFGWGLFSAIFPIIGFIYNRWFLFRGGPLETQKRLEALGHKQRRNARLIGFVNGTLLMLFSLGILCIVTFGASSFIEGAFGVLAAATTFLVGLAAFRWAWRTRM